MKLLILAFTFGAIVASSTPVEAAPADSTSITQVKKRKPKKAKHSKKAGRATKKGVVVKKGKPSELQTDVKFDDSVLHGQYQTPDEATARVENEKALSDLLGVRKHFKDRLITASQEE